MIDQASSQRMLTPPEAAERVAVDPHKIIGFIRSGELPASDLASAGSRRPRYRIHVADLEAFLAKRAAGPVPRATRRRRTALPAGFNEYFGRK